MTGKKKDHWGSLASLLGKAPKQEPEPELPEAAAESAAADPSEPPRPAAPPPKPIQRAPKLAPPKPAPKRRDHWGSVLGQLGVQAPPEPEPEPPVAFEPQVEAASP